MKCTFSPSKHTKDQMIYRGISKEELIEAILKGAKRLQGKKIIALYKKIEVVYVQKPCHYFVITTYLE